MENDIKQFRAIEDGCIYFFDTKINRYRKICDIQSFEDLPISVKQQIKAAKKEAVYIIQLPIE